MKLQKILGKKSGRSHGKVTVRHQGGRQKRYLRGIDFKRDKKDMWGKVIAIEYDPNRNVEIALVLYEDGERRYILAPHELVVGQKVISSESAPIETGNTLVLSKMPIGTLVHNIEIHPGKGGQIVRSAGSAAVVQGQENEFVLVKLPSGEVRRFSSGAYATVGQLGKIEAKNVRIKTAGQMRRKGVRPTVRGTAQNPRSHPHGGGEGRSGIGLKYQKTPYGKPAVGKTRNRKRYSNRLIVSGRKGVR